ncbi:hypothetical protein EDEG_01204 [Edhazardia aedis USNM 41457]|uniref:Uncharacterized protein n=1 Tax=Edhazardia aedis (strain USNM 41457) TaxID=1003232 RepID=J9DPW7_EDHAE|nr:hypothetical protein EDEG_01204 [Edhazardia aedis USNM 41457]|eukprot:EJW04590.1 hypothetical protein EDEG_01204 [Edhazardia aedis USNM 41457]
MKRSDLQEAWLIGNAIFIVLYTYGILRYIIAIPDIVPKQVLSLILLLVYGTTIFNVFLVDIKQLPSLTNFRCMLLFLTMPHKILLFPFYILSLIHTSRFVCERRREFEKYFFYNLAACCMQFQKNGLQLALTAQIVMVVMCLAMIVFQLCSFYTFFLYLFVVFCELQNNKEMRVALIRVRNMCDDVCKNLPGKYKPIYDKIREKVFYLAEENHKKTD